MPSFHNGSVEIAYIDEGEGDPIFLVHGFGSTAGVNWVYPGWVSALTKAGRRVVALDNRGHDASSKLYDRAEYSLDIMAGDVRALMDHLSIERADIMGYSLGSRISCRVALHHPERLRSLIIGGLGYGLIEGGGPGEDVALASCYRRAILLTTAHDLHSIAFPAISTGVYGFPAERAARIAVTATLAAVATSSRLETVIFCCFSEPGAEWHRQALTDAASS